MGSTAFSRIFFYVEAIVQQRWLNTRTPNGRPANELDFLLFFLENGYGNLTFQFRFFNLAIVLHRDRAVIGQNFLTRTTKRENDIKRQKEFIIPKQAFLHKVSIFVQSQKCETVT